MSCHIKVPEFFAATEDWAEEQWINHNPMHTHIERVQFNEDYESLCNAIADRHFSDSVIDYLALSVDCTKIKYRVICQAYHVYLADLNNKNLFSTGPEIFESDDYDNPIY